MRFNAKNVCLSTLLTLSILTGCASLPEAGPFVDGTLELRSALAASGTAVVQELQRMPDGTARAAELAREWEKRVQAADALVNYAESLRDIVDAGNSGSAAAEKVADSVTTLAKTAGIAIPAGEAASVVVDVGRFVYGQISVARASRSLNRALTEVQPAVRQIAEVLLRDIKDIDEILQLANANISQRLQINRQVEIAFRERLLSERRTLYEKATLSENDQKRLLELGQLIEATHEWYDPLQTELASTRSRLRAARDLVTACSASAERWSSTHEQMVLAIKDRRPLNVRNLIEASAEIRSLVNRMREL